MDLLDQFDILRGSRIAGVLSTPRHIAVFGHPADHATMVAVARDVQLHLTCDAYVPRGEITLQNPDDLRIFLMDMELVVFVVSRRFLYEENAASRLVFAIATSTRIRLLTIQVEGGLEREFDRICGSYQLLDRSRDNYQQALASLAGESVFFYNMMPRPKRGNQDGSFTQRGFVSYRKKDRVQLLRLMERIRACPQLLDVALWFDDALVPGEDYNDQIERSLHESDFVILLVTPSVLEEDNYVLRCEYPQALREGKPVLAVVASDVDEQAFRSNYPQVSALVRLDQEGALKRALLDLTHTSDDRCLSPRQLYSLAWDYCLGECTERNPQLAYSLFEEAAEAGDVWAQARLGMDYHTGISIPKNPSKARLWIGRAVRELYELMHAIPSTDRDAWMVYGTLSRLALLLQHYCTLERDYDQARVAVSMRREALDALLEAGVMTGFDNVYTTLVQMGDICCAESAYEDAILYYDQAEQGVLGLEDSLGTFNALLAAASLYANRGNVYKELLIVLQVDRIDYRMEYLEPACNDLEAALPRCLRLNQATNDGFALTFQVARDLLMVAPVLEGLDGGIRKAAQLYGQAYDALAYLWEVDDLGSVDRAQLAYQLALAACYLGTAGRIVPDYGLLEQSWRLFDSIGETEQLAHVEYYLAPGSVRSRLDRLTRWVRLDAGPDQLRSLFSSPFGMVREGRLGLVSGNYRMSAYRCPQCDEVLYKAVFPEGRDFMLPYGNGSAALPCSRVFACPRGHFYAAPRGRRLIDGPTFTALFQDGYDGLQGIDVAWWQYFDLLGDLNAQRSD